MTDDDAATAAASAISRRLRDPPLAAISTEMITGILARPADLNQETWMAHVEGQSSKMNLQVSGSNLTGLTRT
ncbi:hypothetical protein RRF57_004706 [Xylaria bambusicola]|uniref:Uncharacterized protein n=1 Tax=Xylaria bambusicola TaxID=326684 RepID=A0AAN7UP97_9PEZI